MFNKLNKDIPFTVAPNSLIQDKNMSTQARFLYVYMASMPDDWQFYFKNLALNLAMSVDTVKKYMKELERNGWVINHGQKNMDGKFGNNEYTILSEPITVGENLPYGKNTVTEKYRNGKITPHTKETSKQKKQVITKERESTPAQKEIELKVDSGIKTPSQMTEAFGEMLKGNEIMLGQVQDMCKELKFPFLKYQEIISEVFADYADKDQFAMMQIPRPEKRNKFFVKVLSRSQKFIKQRIRNTRNNRIQYLNQTA